MKWTISIYVKLSNDTIIWPVYCCTIRLMGNYLSFCLSFFWHPLFKSHLADWLSSHFHGFDWTTEWSWPIKSMMFGDNYDDLPRVLSPNNQLFFLLIKWTQVTNSSISLVNVLIKQAQKPYLQKICLCQSGVNT